MTSRRSMLKAGMLIGGAGLVGGGVYYQGRVNDRKLAMVLVSLLDYPDLARSKGRRILKNDVGLESLSIGEALNGLLTSAGIDRNKVAEMSQQSLLQSLHRRISLDFVEEKVVFVDGWLLSRTEAHLCTLAYRLS